MKPIAIKEENKERIDAYIRDCEGRATARCISYTGLVDCIKQYDRDLGIPKKHMVGIELDLDINAQTFPSAYKYTPESTHAIVMRRSTGWALADVWRTTCRGPTSEVVVKKMPADAVRAILVRAQAWEFLSAANAAGLFKKECDD